MSTILHIIQHRLIYFSTILRPSQSPPCRSSSTCMPKPRSTHATSVQCKPRHSATCSWKTVAMHLWLQKSLPLPKLPYVPGLHCSRYVCELAWHSRITLVCTLLCCACNRHLDVIDLPGFASPLHLFLTLSWMMSSHGRCSQTPCYRNTHTSSTPTLLSPLILWLTCSPLPLRRRRS